MDAGGLFKEFWTDLSALAFNMDFGLFRRTPGADGLLFPNPGADKLQGDDTLTLFAFLGRILGTCVRTSRVSERPLTVLLCLILSRPIQS